MQKFPFEEVDDLYRDVILDHYRSPRNYGRLDSPDVTSDEYNPICGDRVILDLSISEGLIADAAFTGEGCSITQASASMMTELLPGLTPSEALSLWKTFDRMMDGDETAATELQSRGDLHSLSAVRRFPVRIKCALLAWKALEMGLEEKGLEWKSPR